jgi:hypothetical protein
MTRSSLMTLLGRELGPWAALADLDAAASYALRQFSLAVADATAVTDADLALVAAAQENGVLDVAIWRAVEAILANLSEAELLKIGVTEDPDKVAARLKARAERLYARLGNTYSLGLPTLVLGTLALGGQQQDDPAVPTTNY